MPRSAPFLPLLVGGLVACASHRSPSAPEPADRPKPASTPATEPPAPPPSPAPAPPRPSPGKPNIDPGPRTRPDVVIRPETAAVKEPERLAPPAIAYARGWMPLASTRADAFRRAHPGADGRGVLIAILDTGIDPSVPGLLTTSTGERKVLDLRDFSGEGTVTLRRLAPRGDTVEVAGRRLAGFGRLVGLNATGPYYGGALYEIPLGPPPAADLNGNGVVADTLPVVVTRASDGWVLLADTDGDGSLANEKPVRDYLVGGETFGWAPRGRPAPLAVAANFGDSAREPTLDLAFDTGDHGTFVAGIAAGHDLYGVPGFDGVAPGAQLLGLKIANDAQGGISTTGSMMRALDYAVRFAERRRMPLVLNLSFGVGNEREGEARIDQLIDSVLAAHPDLVLVVSAGNDGPGLSTVGFPGSAARAITVGATLPNAFLPFAGRAGEEQVAGFSARGGELAKPDLVAPGFAYSTVPRFDIGDEVKQGTSFSAPQVSGLVALLRSALARAQRTADARSIKQALMVTARPQGALPYLDEGTGLPDVEAAWRWLEGGRRVPDVAVRAVGAGRTAAYREAGLASPGDTLQTFELVRTGRGGTLTFRLRSDAPWLVAPRTVTLAGSRATVTLRYRAAAFRHPGFYSGVVSGWGADSTLGPAFRLVNTVIVPLPARSQDLLTSTRVEPGVTRRAFFRADSARPFLVRVATWSALQGALAGLHEPGGRPFRGGAQLQAGADSAAAVFRVDGRDAVAGVYEANVAGFPAGSATVSARVEQAPFRLGARCAGDSVAAALENLVGAPVDAEVGLALAGAERVEALSRRGSDVVRLPFVAPAWARSATVDVTMPPGQWERFTDFGVSVFDSVGRQLAKEPLNYAVGRLEVPLPAGHGDMPLELRLFPGFAEPEPAQAWSATVSIRLYADSAAPLPAAGGRTVRVSVPAGETRAAAFALAPPPWRLGQGFDPLGVVVARSAGEVWTREVRLEAVSPAGPAAPR